MALKPFCSVLKNRQLKRDILSLWWLEAELWKMLILAFCHFSGLIFWNGLGEALYSKISLLTSKKNFMTRNISWDKNWLALSSKNIFRCIFGKSIVDMIWNTENTNLGFLPCHNTMIMVSKPCHNTMIMASSIDLQIVAVNILMNYKNMY